jgi:hypothetical protein
MKLRGFLLYPLVVGAITGYAQTAKDPSSPTSPKMEYPASKYPSPRQKKFSNQKTTVDLQREYYERVEAVMKMRKKQARLMKKPQYSNPMYFGHRRPPKKHSPSKMRYCTECGIRH